MRRNSRRRMILWLVISSLFSTATFGFIPTSNYELDVNVIQSRCLDYGSLNILDNKNSQNVCELVMHSPACENVKAERKRQCDLELVVDTNPGVEFISCLKGLWGSTVEFMKFMGSIIDYVIESETRGETNEELMNTMKSAKHFLAMEWSRSLEETQGWGPIHRMRAATHFSKTMGTIIYNMLEESYFSMQENYACLNGAARTEALCEFAGSMFIPPTIVMIKIAKHLLKKRKFISDLAKKDHLIDETLLSKKELDKNRSEFENIDADTLSTKLPYSAEVNFLERLDLNLRMRHQETPERLNEMAKVQNQMIEKLANKLDIPIRHDDFTQNGNVMSRLTISVEDLKTVVSPASYKLLKYLKEHNVDNIVIGPELMIDKSSPIIRKNEKLFVSAKGLGQLLTAASNQAQRKAPVTPLLEKVNLEPNTKNIEDLAKQLNSDGFAVRVITLKKYENGKTVNTKALQFNQYASDRNHPGVLKLQRFRNNDFRQKILFYPNSYSRALGSSDRSTRAVAFNFTNLEELLHGGHMNTVPHEFRHAKFEYNRSKGKESPYDLRVLHTKDGGKLHNGGAYRSYFSMEEVYNHSQDIYHTARKLNRDANFEQSLMELGAKANTIINITKGFRNQNDSLILNYEKDLNSSKIQIPDNDGVYIKIGENSMINAVRDNNYYSLEIKDGDVLHTIPMSTPEAKTKLTDYVVAIQKAKSTGDLQPVREEIKKVFEHVMDKNDERINLLSQLEPKAQELIATIKKRDYSNANIDRIVELSRQISQASKGRGP